MSNPPFKDNILILEFGSMGNAIPASLHLTKHGVVALVLTDDFIDELNAAIALVRGASKENDQ